VASRIVLRWSWIALFVGLSLGLPGACQKDTPTSSSPTQEPRLVALEVSRAVLGPGDTTLVRATVVRGTEPAVPADGVGVRFSEMLEQQSGTFSKLQGTTGADGVAESVFRAAAEDSGLVTLRAEVGESVRYAMVLVTRQATGGLNLAVRTASNQTSLPADGLSQIEVEVTATQGALHSPVASLPLILTAGDQFLDENSNGVFDEGDRVVAAGDRDGDGVWDAQGTVPEMVATDPEGIARFSYEAGSDVGPVFLKITGPGASYELRLFQHSLSLQVAVSAGARELLADGVSQASVNVSVRDWNGDGVGGVLVKLTAGEPFTDVDGDGYYDARTDRFEDRNGNQQWDAMGTITSVVSTDASGTAAAVYRAGLSPGVATLKATTTSGASETVLRLLAVPPAKQVLLECQATTLYADGASTTQGTVEVRDINATPLAGKVVRLSAGERFEDVDSDGRFTPGTDRLLQDFDHNGQWTAVGEIEAEVTTGADGRAIFTYRGGLVPQSVWIRAAVDHVSQETKVVLQDLPPVQSLEVDAAFERLTVLGGGGLDQTQITAVCRDGAGQTVPAGVTVNFSIASGPGGGETLEGALGGVVAARTDEDGTAHATLIAGTLPGLIQVGASTGTLLSSTGVFVEAGLAASLACSADSVSLMENSSCMIRAYVYDQAHNAVKDGTVVLFHADEGLIYTQNGQGTATTTNGLATAIFTAVPSEGGGDGTAEVVVETNGGIGGGVSCTTYIQMPRSPGAISRLTLTSTYPEIAVNGTGGVEQTRIRAQGFDLNNNPVGPDRSVTFRITQGPGGGEAFVDFGAEAEVLTDAAGVAQVVLESGTIAGTVVVTAGATGTQGVSEHTAIGIAAGPPVHLSVGVENCNVLACGFVNALNNVVVVASDVYRNPVRDGTAVHFTSTHGMVEGDQGLGTATTERGVAVGVWHSDGDCGIVTVTASTLGGTLVAEGSFIGSGLPAYNEFVIPAADTVSVNADGRSSVSFMLQVLDSNLLYPLPAEVDVTADYGTIGDLDQKTDDGCHSSTARGKYTSVTLLTDDSYTIPDDGVGAIDVVLGGAKMSFNAGSFVVKLRTGRANAGKSSIDLESVPAGRTATFSITIKDGWGNPLGGHEVSIWVSDGTVDESGVTDAYGQITGISFLAPEEDGSVLLEVHDLDPNYGGDMLLRKTINISAP